MRKTAIALLALALMAIVAGPAMAVSFWSETFTYAAGPLVANSLGNWTTHSGTPPIDIQVLAGGVCEGNNANAPDDNRTFPPQDSTATVYACFLARIPLISGAPKTNYFAHFKDTGTFNFVTRVFVAPQGATFSFGLSHFSSTMQILWPTALAYDTWYTIAIKYNGATDTSTLWVNPVSEASASISATSVAPPYTNPQSVACSAFALRQSSTGTGTTWKFDVDNVMVGTTFSDLCPNPTPNMGTTWGRLKTIYR